MRIGIEESKVDYAVLSDGPSDEVKRYTVNSVVAQIDSEDPTRCCFTKDPIIQEAQQKLSDIESEFTVMAAFASQTSTIPEWETARGQALLGLMGIIISSAERLKKPEHSLAVYAKQVQLWVKEQSEKKAAIDAKKIIKTPPPVSATVQTEDRVQTPSVEVKVAKPKLKPLPKDQILIALQEFSAKFIKAKTDSKDKKDKDEKKLDKDEKKVDLKKFQHALKSLPHFEKSDRSETNGMISQVKAELQKIVSENIKKSLQIAKGLEVIYQSSSRIVDGKRPKHLPMDIVEGFDRSERRNKPRPNGVSLNSKLTASGANDLLKSVNQNMESIKKFLKDEKLANELDSAYVVMSTSIADLVLIWQTKLKDVSVNILNQAHTPLGSVALATVVCVTSFGNTEHIQSLKDANQALYDVAYAKVNGDKPTSQLLAGSLFTPTNTPNKGEGLTITESSTTATAKSVAVRSLQFGNSPV